MKKEKKDKGHFIRMNKTENDMLEYVQKCTGKSYSDIIRNGIRIIYNLEKVKHE